MKPSKKTKYVKKNNLNSFDRPFFKRSGQMEIFGLALIVVLVILGFFLAIGFLAKSKPSELKERFTTSSLAANTLTTLLEIDTDCEDRNYEELIQECQTGRLICNLPTGTINSCEYAEQISKEIFDKTFEKWGNDYVFKLTTQDNDEFFKIVSKDLESQNLKDCPGSIKFKTQPIKSRTGNTLILSLAICS